MELIIGIIVGCCLVSALLAYKAGTLSGYIKRAKEFEASAVTAFNANANPNAQTPKAMAFLQRIEGHLGKIAAAPAAAPTAATGVTPDGALKA